MMPSNMSEEEYKKLPKWAKVAYWAIFFLVISSIVGGVLFGIWQRSH